MTHIEDWVLTLDAGLELTFARLLDEGHVPHIGHEPGTGYHARGESNARES